MFNDGSDYGLFDERFWLNISILIINMQVKTWPKLFKIRLLIRLVLAPNYNSNNSMWDTNSYWIEICEIYSDQSHLEIVTVLVRGWNNTSQAESKGKIILSLILSYDWTKPLDKIDHLTYLVFPYIWHFIILVMFKTVF